LLEADPEADMSAGVLQVKLYLAYAKLGEDGLNTAAVLAN
jgi:hypothetical protein